MKDIKKYYFNFLTSLKFENLNEQKSLADYRNSDMHNNEEISKPDHLTL